jgi:16S rRNA (guanine527-N7)-methyltransferase
MCVVAVPKGGVPLFHVKHSLPGRAPVSRETQQKLDLYASLLLKWNRKINLISRHSEGDLWQRHFEDALQLVPLIPSRVQRAADLGSGAGFPGMVLAIATGISFTLIEADQRKAAFLREVAAAVSAPAAILPCRIESAHIEACDLVTARALAPLSDLLALTLPLLKPGGAALFPKGGHAEEDLTNAKHGWHMKVERHQSVTDPQGVILRLTEVRRA